MTRIIYLCNSKMAFPALQQLLTDGVLVALAVTDIYPDVVHQAKEFSTQFNLPLYLLSRSTCNTQLEHMLEELQPDAVFVMTFPWRIPARMLTMPRLGFFNFHPGKLPEMRGADPIFECVRQQKTEAVCSVHVMDAEFDSGNVLLQQSVAITPEFTYGMLCGRMAYLAAQLCADLVKAIKEGADLKGDKQNEQNARYWPKVGPEQLRIRWDEMSWEEIKALVKACNPVTKGVPAIINGWQIGICDVSEVNIEGDTSQVKPGMVVVADLQNGLLIYCKNGKALKLEVFYSEEGVMAGHKLAFYGIAPGHMFT